MATINADTILIFGILLSFGAGIISFLSPCVLPIFPAYMSYITGISMKELQGNQTLQIRRKLLTHAVFFLLGVSLLFMSLGIGASYVGQWLQGMLFGDEGVLIQRIAGIFIIVMGLFVAGWLNIPFLMQEKRMQMARKPVSYASTFFVGFGFAAGWTPCIGPIFGSVLFMAISHPAKSLLYTGLYVIGFAVPFLALTFFLGSSRWIVRYSGILMKIGGISMIILGIILFTGQMTQISGFFLKLVEDTWFENIG